MWATWRSRSVGGRSAPRASTTSWPWAHVSISRAVMNERALIAGPYHGTRTFGSSVRACSTRRRPLLPPVLEELLRSEGPALLDGRIGAAPASDAWICSASSANASGSVSAIIARWSKNHRWLIWSPTLHPGAGVGVSSAAGVSTRSRSALSAARSSLSASTTPSSPLTGSGQSQGGRRPRTLTRAVGRATSPRPSWPAPSWPAPSWPAPSWPAPSWPAPSWPRPSWPAAFLAGAFLAGAFLARLLGGAFLAGAFLAAAFVATAFVAGAFLAGAFLATAFLAGAFLAAAFLAAAFLAGPSWPAPSWRLPSWRLPCATSSFSGSVRP